MRDNDFLTQKDCDVLLGSKQKESGYFENITIEKREIVKGAILENLKKSLKNPQNKNLNPTQIKLIGFFPGRECN